MPSGRSPSRSARLALLAIVATAPGCGPDEPTALNNLELFAVDDEGKRIALLDYKLTTPGLSYAWTQSQLSPQLTSHPLNQLQVRYYSHPTTRTEAHLFPFDPAQRAAELRAIAAKELTGAIKPSAWDALFTDPTHGTQVTLPWDLVVPFPNEDVTEGDPFVPLDRAEVLLSPFKFLGSPLPHALHGASAQPNGGGSVKAARVYDHGACSRELPLQPRLDVEIDGALKRLTAKLKTIHSGLKPIVHYARAAVFLDHGDPKDPTDLRDGFFVDAHLTIQAPQGHPDIHLWAFLEARIVLDDGILTLAYDKQVVKVEHDCCVSLVTNAFVEQEVKLALGEIATRLWEEGHDAQHVDFGPAYGACNPRFGDPCKGARESLEDLVGYGAPAVPGYALDGGDIATMISTVGQADRWSCVWDPAATAHTCRFFVPVKRFNVFPDAVEAVWFDGEEPKNPAFALWVAAHTPVEVELLTKAREAMCQWQPTHAHDEFYNRTFAWVRR